MEGSNSLRGTNAAFGEKIPIHTKQNLQKSVRDVEVNWKVKNGSDEVCPIKDTKLQ